MTLRWHEVRIAFLYLFYSQSHTEAPVVCAVFSSLELSGTGMELPLLQRVLPSR